MHNHQQYRPTRNFEAQTINLTRLLATAISLNDVAGIQRESERLLDDARYMYPKKRMDVCTRAVMLLQNRAEHLREPFQTLLDATKAADVVVNEAIFESREAERFDIDSNRYADRQSKIADLFLEAYRIDPDSGMHAKDAAKRMLRCGREEEAVDLLEGIIQDGKLIGDDLKYAYDYLHHAYRNLGREQAAKQVMEDCLRVFGRVTKGMQKHGLG